MRLLAARFSLSHAARAARVTLAAVVAAVAGGCGESDDGLSPSDVVGRYALVSFRGSPVPLSVTGNGVRSELLSGSLDLRGDRSFEISLEARDTDLGDGSVEDFTDAYSGTYTLRGRVITFADTEDADRDGVGDLDGAQATVSGTTVTFGDFVFRQ